MFNQKINHYLSENPGYLNTVTTAPYVSRLDIHNCGTSINKFSKPKNDNTTLQTWCEKNVAVQSFGMRPIVNSTEYFNNIKIFLQKLIINDTTLLKQSGLGSEFYSYIDDYGQEPLNSFLQMIKLDVTDYIQNFMGSSSDNIPMFTDYNPLCEGFVITDIEIETYISQSNTGHFYHDIVFSAFNTTRYSTISFKCQLYQDTTELMGSWDNNVNKVKNGLDTTRSDVKTKIYIYLLDLLNDILCVTGQESDCTYKGYTLEYPEEVEKEWLQVESLENTKINEYGNFDPDTGIEISDEGPSNFENLVKEIKDMYFKQ